MSSLEHAQGSFHFDIRNVNTEGKLYIFPIQTLGKMFFFKFFKMVF